MTILPAVTKVELAKKTIARLRELGFRPYLGAQSALLIKDVLGNRRDVLRYAPTLFDDIAGGLNEEPGLLDVGQDEEYLAERFRQGGVDSGVTADQPLSTALDKALTPPASICSSAPRYRR